MNDNNSRQDEDSTGEPAQPATRKRDVVMSMLAALFGVQSEQNRQRDFGKGKPGDYIGVFVTLVIALIVIVAIVVNLVLNAAVT